MGNSSTKEQRPPPARLRSSDARSTSSPASSASDSPAFPPSQERLVYNVRGNRGSRPDLSTLLGIRSGLNPDSAGLEVRRETKQEREARKLEKERVAREKERERSMRDESVDGGFLVTQGVYTGTEDYNKGIVRQLMIERRIAPFWRGLNEHSDSWTENQLVAAARGRPIPAPDEIPVEEDVKSAFASDPGTKATERSIINLTLPISSRSQSFNSDTSSSLSPIQPSFVPVAVQPQPSPSGSTLFRGRAKTLATLTTSPKSTQPELILREINLPRDPYVSGQPLEAYLYKDASECPICFLSYPPYLNKTRCCDQAICSECFVQIKRPDPHPPEHVDPTAPPRPPTEEVQDPEELISEPAACPFCVQPEFGITYEPPPFRRGLTYVNPASTHPLNNASSAMSSATSLDSARSYGGRGSPARGNRRRTTSLSATNPSVITTDRIRPDWHQKLAAARAHTARRSAAATALHTAAYLMGGRGQESDGRGLGPFGRRGILRRTSGGDSPSGASSSHLNMLALMSERYAAASSSRGEEGEPSMTPGPRGSSRRNRVDDLEDMMMMEAIRLSLAAEEDRRKKEEKDAKKEAKKKDKESKKAEKAAKKTGIYPSSANQSNAGIDNTSDGSPFQYDGTSSSSGKGKAVQQNNLNSLPERASNIPSSMTAAVDPQEHLERARAQILPIDLVPLSSPYSSTPYRPSHLRTLSNASSSTSSIDDSAPGSLRSDLRGQGSSVDVSPSASGINIPAAGSAQDTYISGTPPGGGAGMEPMFNFRSLAAMVGDEKSKDFKHEENPQKDPDHETGESHDISAKAGSGENSTYPNYAGLQVDGASQQASNDEAAGLPAFKFTEPSRSNSDVKTLSEEYRALNDETKPHGNLQLSS